MCSVQRRYTRYHAGSGKWHVALRFVQLMCVTFTQPSRFRAKLSGSLLWWQMFSGHTWTLHCGWHTSLLIFTGPRVHGLVCCSKKRSSLFRFGFSEHWFWIGVKSSGLTVEANKGLLVFPSLLKPFDHFLIRFTYTCQLKLSRSGLSWRIFRDFQGGWPTLLGRGVQS